MTISAIAAQLKIAHKYTCAKCQNVAIGTTQRIEVTCQSSQDLKNFLDLQRPRSHYMPMGWSYDGEFTCPACTDNR